MYVCLEKCNEVHMEKKQQMNNIKMQQCMMNSQELDKSPKIIGENLFLFSCTIQLVNPLELLAMQSLASYICFAWQCCIYAMHVNQLQPAAQSARFVEFSAFLSNKIFYLLAFEFMKFFKWNSCLKHFCLKQFCTLTAFLLNCR